jgi:hypothetical protein
VGKKEYAPFRSIKRFLPGRPTAAAMSPGLEIS